MSRFSPANVFLSSAVAVALLGAGACTGKISDSSESPTGASGSSAGAAGTSGGSTTGAAGAAATDPNAAGLMPMRRLTNREYNNTVRDLLGDTSQPASQFPSDRDPTFEFRRAGDVATQDATILRTAAETLATSAAPKLVSGMLLPCDPTAGEPACAQKFITTFGERAFRRPVATAEVTRLTALYTTARTTLALDFKGAMGLLVEAMLQSPQFLYHWEEVPTDASIHEGSVIRLGGYQIASRLSYFLWGSMPDDALLASATAGQLDTAAGVQTAARRLLADAKAQETVASFFSDWLALDGLPDRTKDTTVYTTYTPAVMQAMLDETSTFVRNVTFNGDGRLATLLGVPYSFVNATLAPLYGAQATGALLTKTDLNPTQRAGFLTQGAFLALTGNADGSNPVRRGKAVYTKLLCKSLPPPPANVPLPMPASAGGTTRQRFEVHDQNACAKGCHSAMDPIGFGFEIYDGIGQYRTTDNGLPVDATGSITLDGTSHDFHDADGDAASLQATAAAFAADTASLQDLMVAVATMRSFRYRSPSPGEMQ